MSIDVVLKAKSAGHAVDLLHLVTSDGWAGVISDADGGFSVVVPVRTNDQADLVKSSLSLVIPAEQSMVAVPAMRQLR